MNRDVDLVLVRDLLETFIEVFHVLDEQRSAEVEVALLILAIVNDVDHDAVLEVCALYVRQQVGRCLLLAGRRASRWTIVSSRDASSRSTRC